MARILIVLGLALLVAGAANAQNWPTRPVKIIVQVGAGTNPDIIGRLLADRLSKTIGQSFFIENITGGGGLIANQTAARAAADGYTLYFAGLGTLVTDRTNYKDPGFDPDRDFVHIAIIYEEGLLAIAVHPDVPVKNVPELIALAKAQPGQLSYGVSSVGLLLVFGQYFTKTAGIDMLAVPYKSPAQQMQDVAAGRTQVVISGIPTLDPYSKPGRIRIIAVDATRRFPGMEDIQTISETLPGFRMSGMGVLVGPKGLPPQIVERLNREMDPIVRDPEYIRQLRQYGFTVNGAGNARSIAEFIRDRRESWDRVVKALSIQPQ